MKLVLSFVLLAFVASCAPLAPAPVKTGDVVMARDWNCPRCYPESKGGDRE